MLIYVYIFSKYGLFLINMLVYVYIYSKFMLFGMQNSLEIHSFFPSIKNEGFL